MSKNYDVVIIGAGVTGSALAWTMSQYADIESVAVFDKYGIATVNSQSKFNSQTLHCGDIETNYTLAKATQVRDSANLVKTYAKNQKNANEIIYNHSKLLLGVGEQEVEKIKKRHHEFSVDFPYMDLLFEDGITKLEPNITKNRKEPIAAMGVANDFCAVDFEKLSHSFIQNATNSDKVTINLQHKFSGLERTQDGYQLKFHTIGQLVSVYAKFVVFATGAYSLTYAQSLGYGHNYGLLSVAGSFYFGKEALNGKVYTIQNDKLPFAAVHGDPDVNALNQTRFGPTALILPQLERYKHNTYLDYLKVLGLDKHILIAFGKLLKDKDIRNYIGRNFLYEAPVLGRHLFTKEVQKIIPSLIASDLKFAKGFGGLRPQVIDKDQEQLVLGEAHINTSEGLIFNITPSPGASTCLANAKKDAQKICQYLNIEFDLSKFKSNFDTTI